MSRTEGQISFVNLKNKYSSHLPKKKKKKKDHPTTSNHQSSNTQTAMTEPPMKPKHV